MLPQKSFSRLSIVFAILAALAGIAAVPPRPALADFVIVVDNASFEPDSIYVGMTSDLTFEVHSTGDAAPGKDIVITLPDNAIRTGAPTGTCSPSAIGFVPTVTINLNVPDSNDYCSVSFPVQFNQAGDFVGTDFPAFVGGGGGDTTNFLPTITVEDLPIYARAEFQLDPEVINLGETADLLLAVGPDAIITAITASLAYTMAVILPAGATISTNPADRESNCTVNSLSQSGSIVTLKATMNDFAEQFCNTYVAVSFASPGIYQLPSGSSIGAISFAPTMFEVWEDVSADTQIEVLDGGNSTNPAAFCSELPDLAVSPQLIEIAPGGRATVELAMRNLCPDRPFDESDLLISFSDGLTVVETNGGMVGMGQRAADQRFALAAGETKRWTVTVEAGANLATAPLHITEHFVTGRDTRRIDGVFITPAPAPAAAAAPAAPVAPAPAPAPAPLPAALPNTSSAGSLLPALAAAIGLVAAGRAVLRRRR